MKYILTFFFLLSLAYGQKPNLSHANKTGWIPTGKTQIWNATIYDGHGKITKGYIRMRELSFVPKSMQSGPNVWSAEGAVYDGEKKLLKPPIYPGHIEFIHPKTLELKKI